MTDVVVRFGTRRAAGAFSLWLAIAISGPRLIGTLAVGKHVHNIGVDAKTHHIWAVWGSKLHGDFIEPF